MLTLYRRHSSSCLNQISHLSAKAKRAYMDCACPIWVYGTHDNQLVPRRSTGHTRLEDAQAEISRVINSTQPERDSPTISGCIAKFLPSHKSQIEAVTLDDYERVLYRFEAWCRDRGVLLMKDLT